MIARWFVHEVSVETLDGASAYGDVFSAPVRVMGWFSSSQKVLRETFGEQVVADSAFYTSLTNAAVFTIDSVVTAADGSKSRVVKVNVNDTAGLMPNVEHVAVALI